MTRIVSADEKHVYATLLTMPDQLLTDPLDEATVILDESPDGAPQRVTAWFYPGDTVGNHFIYPKTDSSRDLGSVMGSVGTTTRSAATHTAKAVGASSEFVGFYSVTSLRIRAELWHMLPGTWFRSPTQHPLPPGEGGATASGLARRVRVSAFAET